jgi:proteasome lid subunit RPN8/RPN11
MNIRLAPGILDDVIEHAKSCYPNEGCGLLSGRQYVADRFVPMENTRASESEYAMDPQQLVQQLRSFRESGEVLVAIYHSHPFGSARPSKRDVASSYYPDAASIIVSLAEPECPRVAAFRIIAGEVIEIELHAIV